MRAQPGWQRPPAALAGGMSRRSENAATIVGS